LDEGLCRVPVVFNIVLYHRQNSCFS